MTKKKCPEVTLKSVKIGNIPGREGIPFTATVCVNGKKFAIAHELGDGGPIDFEPLPGKLYDKVFNEVIRELDRQLGECLPPMKIGGYEIKADLEIRVNELVAEYELWERIQSDTKKGILGYDTKKHNVYLWGSNKKGKPSEISINKFKEEHPEVHPIFNELGKEEAIREFTKIEEEQRAEADKASIQ